MRENVNASFTPYEWKPINKRMTELNMNRYSFFRYCVLKESGVELDRTEQKDQKSNSGRTESKPSIPDKRNEGRNEEINDIDNEDSGENP